MNAIGEWLAEKAGKHAVDFASRGELSNSINHLQAIDRILPSKAVERELLKLRYLAFRERHIESQELSAASLATTQDEPTPYRTKADPPELRVTTAEELSLERIARDIAAQGCVWVKGFLRPKRASYMKDAIDRMLADREDYQRTGKATRWYTPFDALESRPERRELAQHRVAMGMYPLSVFMADSPAIFSAWIETIRKTGLGNLVEKYIGERPTISLSKTVMRRQPPMDHNNGWHQDGAFLGSHIKTLNVWVALTDCGETSPGLDILPRRIGLMQTGTPGALFDWSVSEKLVEETYPGEAIRPKFEAGDALIFDQFFLHRTASSPEMNKDRYAIESWFFSPSQFPEKYSGFMI